MYIFSFREFPNAADERLLFSFLKMKLHFEIKLKHSLLRVHPIFYFSILNGKLTPRGSNYIERGSIPFLLIAIREYAASTSASKDD